MAVPLYETLPSGSRENLHEEGVPIEGRYYEQGTRPASQRTITAFHIRRLRLNSSIDQSSCAA